MPTNSGRSRDVRCPFYKGDCRCRITCEGPADSITSVSLFFLSQSDWDIHMHVFCYDRYKNCEVYQMIYQARFEE